MISSCQEKGFLVSYYGFRSRNSHTCYSDKYHYAAVNYDGNIFNCTARDYSEKHKIGEINEDGEIIRNSNIISKRLSKATFENEHCLKCNYLGLCFGPCSQKMLEFRNKEINFNNICTLYNSDIDSFMLIEAKNRQLLS